MTESDGEKPHDIKAGIEPCDRDCMNWKQERGRLTNCATGSPTNEMNFRVFPHHKGNITQNNLFLRRNLLFNTTNSSFTTKKKENKLKLRS